MGYRIGLEIEAYGLNGNEMKEIVESVGGTFGGLFGYHDRSGRNPRTADCGGYYDEKIDGPHFYVSRDGSLHSMPDMKWDEKGSFELVCPILYGEKGLAMLSKICTRMQRAGAWVDSTCGTHINMGVAHLGRVQAMSDRNKMEIGRRVCEIYSHFQPVFDALSPNCRRTDNNPFPGNGVCRTSAPFRGRCVVNMLSLHNFIMGGRIEFRQPGFTLDFKKILGWGRLLNSVLTCAINEQHSNFRVPASNFTPNLEGMVEMLNPGVRAARWADGRIRHMITTFTRFRDERMQAIGTSANAAEWSHLGVA